jgi:RNA polymerase sigma-70 factor (ECF subfamily)
MGSEPDRDTAREDRFSTFVESHADTVNRYLLNRHRAGDSLEAEDLLAEVFTIAWRRFEDVPSDAEAAWLIGVARNRLMNMQSKQSRRSRLSATVRPPSLSPSAEDEAVADIALSEAIESLPATEREVFTLSVWEGLTPRELGIVLGITQNAAAIRLSRARSLLLSRLAKDPDEMDRAVVKDTE